MQVLGVELLDLVGYRLFNRVGRLEYTVWSISSLVELVPDLPNAVRECLQFIKRASADFQAYAGLKLGFVVLQFLMLLCARTGS